MMKRVVMTLFVLALSGAGIGTASAQELPPQCERLQSLGTNLIWKGCAASGHLSKDPRGNGVALIAKKGTSFRPDACMRIYKPDGTQIGAMYLYPYNDPRAYAWRGYSNYVRGCGAGDTMSKIRQRSQNGNVYIQLNKRTKKCVKLNKVYSNINSTQRCPR